MKLRHTLTILTSIFLAACWMNPDDPGNTGTTSNTASSVYTAVPLSNVLYRDLVSVPGGFFPQTNTMGTGFLHFVSAYRIAKYEVTYQLWYTVYQWAIVNGYTFANAGVEDMFSTPGSAPTIAMYKPVTDVNWRDTIVWCNAYSAMAGFVPVYTNGTGTIITNSSDSNSTECDSAGVNWNASGYRLPTEGQWQFAASYQDGSSWTRYDWASGATADLNSAAACQAVAWYNTNSGNRTHNAGTKTANQLGIYDMSGNVWEWCWDGYGTWPGNSTDYRGTTNISYRVIRGGDWFTVEVFLQVGHRYFYNPYFESGAFGFRVCLP